jgi:hypothetical protein
MANQRTVASLYLGLTDHASALAVLDAEGEERQSQMYQAAVLERWSPPVSYPTVVDAMADSLVNLLAERAPPELPQTPGHRPRSRWSYTP